MSSPARKLNIDHIHHPCNAYIKASNYTKRKETLSSSSFLSYKKTLIQELAGKMRLLFVLVDEVMSCQESILTFNEKRTYTHTHTHTHLSKIHCRFKLSDPAFYVLWKKKKHVILLPKSSVWNESMKVWNECISRHNKRFDEIQ